MLAPSGHYRKNFTRKLRYKKKITLSLHSPHGLPSLHDGLHFNMTVPFSFARGEGGGGWEGAATRSLAIHTSTTFSSF